MDDRSRPLADVQADLYAADDHYEAARYEQSVALYEKALRALPDFAPAKFNLGQGYLMLGQLHAGYTMAESRWELDALQCLKQDLPQPLWLGQKSLAGKTIYLWPEQGFGDSIQYSRYALMLAKEQVNIILAAELGLYRLFVHNFAKHGIQVISFEHRKPPAMAFDYQCPLMSLPLACGTHTVADIPYQVPYLSAIESERIVWQAKIAASQLRHGLRVGLVWAGGDQKQLVGMDSVNPIRSIPLQDFLILTHTRKQHGICFFSLQLGAAKDELRALQATHADAQSVVDLTDDIADWSDTAACIANLDLVISCDTAAAHLAAAMGKPTWLISRFNGCPRWLIDRTDSPWYPTMTIFRQQARGQWEDVIAAVSLKLTALAESEIYESN